MKKIIFTILLIILPILAKADAVEIGGIYYNLISKVSEAEVTSNPNKYSGNIVIPESVEYNDKTYKVTKIGDNAFKDCRNLTSVSISQGVTSIGESAFEFNEFMVSINLPNTVVSIGRTAFKDCKALTSLNIPNSVTSIERCAFYRCTGLTSVNISNGLTKIDDFVFYRCSSLTDITIPNNIISIGEGAFSECEKITSVVIPGNVTSIGNEAFANCSALTSVSLPNSITSIGRSAFYQCSHLTSITIPDNVSAIRDHTFRNCNSLTTVIIPNSVVSIGIYAFSGCSDILDVYCYASEVPSTQTNAFKDSYVESSTLHVPPSAITSYKNTAPWSSFKNIIKIDMPEHTLTYMVDGVVYKTYQFEEGASITPESAPIKEGYTFSGWSEIPEKMPAHDVTVTGSFVKNETQKCAKPIISVVGGKIKLSCDTENVKFKTTVTCKSDSKDIEDEEIILSSNVVCNLSVYATKEGYKDSDVATKEITLRLGAAGDANADGEVDIADAVQIVNFIVGKVNALSRTRQENNSEPQ